MATPNGKPVHIKPGLYAIFYEQLKLIALDFGYNLVVHGSMQRDLDLIAIPWIDTPRDSLEMIKEFERYLTGKEHSNLHCCSILPGGRKSYAISLNRGDRHGEWVRYEDKEYYIDISITPFIDSKVLRRKQNKELKYNTNNNKCT